MRPGRGITRPWAEGELEVIGKAATRRGGAAYAAGAECPLRGKVGPMVDKHWIGVAAQVALSGWLGIPWIDTPYDGPAKPNVGPTASGQWYLARGIGAWGHKLIVRPKEPDCPYVLVLVSPERAVLMGWIHGQDAKATRYLRAEAGLAAAYFVRPEELAHMLVLPG